MKGSGNSYTTLYRANDVRLGRWFSTDPVDQAWQSPYTSMNNNPVLFNDEKGDFILLIIGGIIILSETEVAIGLTAAVVSVFTINHAKNHPITISLPRPAPSVPPQTAPKPKAPPVAIPKPKVAPKPSSPSNSTKPKPGNNTKPNPDLAPKPDPVPAPVALPKDNPDDDDDDKSKGF